MAERCFFCGQPLSTMARLADHLILRHRKELVCGVKLNRLTRDDGVWCWCGGKYAICQITNVYAVFGGRHKQRFKQTFAEHLEERGGLAAHLLEIGLNLEPLRNNQ